jgi:hypothetical protein
MSVLRETLCLLTWPHGETVLADLLLELITDARSARRTEGLVSAPGEEDLDFDDAGPSASDDGPRLGKAYMRDMGVGEADVASVLDVWDRVPSEYRTFIREGRDVFLRALFSCVVPQCVKHHSDTVADLLVATVDGTVLDVRSKALPIWVIYFDVLRRFSEDFTIHALDLCSSWLGVLFDPFSRYLSGAGATSAAP